MKNPSIIRQDVKTSEREVVAQDYATNLISEFYYLGQFEILFMLQSGVVFAFSRWTFSYGYVCADLEAFV